MELTEFRAVAQQALGDYSAAASSYRELLRHDPSQSRWWMGLAIAADADGQRDQAREAYRQAIDTRLLNSDLSQYAQQRLAQL